MALNEREIVLDMLLRLHDGEKSHQVLKDGLDNLLYIEKAKRAFISRVFEGSIEKKIFLDYVIDSFSKTAVKKMKPLILALLRLTVYQIIFMDRVPDSAAINEAVKLSKKRGFVSLSGFVNGVLRTISRNKENLPLPDKEKDRVLYLSVVHAMPKNLVTHFLSEYKEDAEAILESFNKEPKLSIRVNTEKTGREELLLRLRAEGVDCEASPLLENSIHILKLDNLSFLESFAEGDFFIQAESSQLIGEIAGIKEGDTVLDLCAAPGGKSLLSALYTGKGGQVLSFDVSDFKLSLIHDNAERLGLCNITARLNDATILNPDLIEGGDVVLCDLPCSGLGVMGRKKDIRFHVSEDKICGLASLQKSMLENAIRYVKPGGTLIFSTCTMTKVENEENFLFLKDHEELSPVDFSKDLPEGLSSLKSAERLYKEAKLGYLEILPGDFDSDGFFISKFIRKNE